MMRPADLCAYVDGQLSDEVAKRVELELEKSPALQEQLTQLLRQRLLLDQALQEAEEQDGPVEYHSNEERFDAYLRLKMAEEDVKELETRLEKEPALRKAFAAYCRKRTLLEDAGLPQKEKDAQPSPKAQRSGRRIAFHPIRFGQIAALLVLLLGGGLWLARDLLFQLTVTAPSSTSEQLGQLVDQEGEILHLNAEGMPVTDPERGLMPGDRIASGNGMGRIRLRDGSELDLGMHSTLLVAMEASDPNFTLRKGQLFCRISSQNATEPLSFAMSELEVDVVGTEFRLSNYVGRSNVELLEGQLRVRSPGRRNDQLLSAGEYAIGLQEGLQRGKLHGQVTDFTLINIESRETVPGYERITDPLTLRLSELPSTHVTFRANLMPLKVEHIQMILRGPEGFRTLQPHPEEFYPYLLGSNSKEHVGNIPDRIDRWKQPLIPGNYELQLDIHVEGETRRELFSFRVEP